MINNLKEFKQVINNYTWMSEPLKDWYEYFNEDLLNGDELTLSDIIYSIQDTGMTIAYDYNKYSHENKEFTQLQKFMEILLED
ncbi:MAG: hypothetical protein LBT10_06835 [Methanobrevibacter sp.]|jgi:hypothetical protein|nr:hypothetical protein [Methanobrevibacter sp.]